MTELNGTPHNNQGPNYQRSEPGQVDQKNFSTRIIEVVQAPLRNIRSEQAEKSYFEKVGTTEAIFLKGSLAVGTVLSGGSTVMSAGLLIKEFGASPQLTGLCLVVTGASAISTYFMAKAFQKVRNSTSQMPALREIITD